MTGLYALIDPKYRPIPTMWRPSIDNTIVWLDKPREEDLPYARTTPLLAVFMDPPHRSYPPREELWTVKCEAVRSDRLKVICKSLTRVTQLPIPEVTLEQKVAFGILCNLRLCSNSDIEFTRWALEWLSGRDRSAEAAKAAADRMNAIKATKAVVYADVERAAAWAAEAAVRAAEAKVPAEEAKAQAAEEAVARAKEAEERVTEAVKRAMEARTKAGCVAKARIWSAEAKIWSAKAKERKTRAMALKAVWAANQQMSAAERAVVWAAEGVAESWEVKNGERVISFKDISEQAMKF